LEQREIKIQQLHIAERMSHAPNTVPLRDQSLFMAGSGTADKYFFGKHLLIQQLKSQK
jgi:hypothetical protein